MRHNAKFPLAHKQLSLSMSEAKWGGCHASDGRGVAVNNGRDSIPSPTHRPYHPTVLPIFITHLVASTIDSLPCVP
jgi:hypothetical protein